MSASRAVIVASLALIGLCGHASARDKIIGVSWANLTEAHWQLDEAAIRRAVELNGDKLVSADAQGSADRQLTGVNELIAAGANALIIQAVDPGAIAPALAAAAAEKIPVIAYEEPIEDAAVTWIAYDPAEAGRVQVQTLARLAPQGSFARLAVKADPIAARMGEGADSALGTLPDVKIAATEEPGTASAEEGQAALDRILATPGQQIAAVLASDDRLAAGAIASLTAHGQFGVPVAGNGASAEGLNRIAAGTQALTLWADPRLRGKIAGTAASALAAATAQTGLEGARPARTFAGSSVNAILLKPVAVTRDTLGTLVSAGWIGKDELCRNVDPAVFALCQ